MADMLYADLAQKNNQLIRKAVDGSAFIADITASPITTLTVDSVTTPGTPTLNDLPAEYTDLGLIDDAGAVFADAVSTSDITSWGKVQPTRRDITSDVETLHIVCQETKLQTIAAYTGVAASALVPDATTGEVSVAKPVRPATIYHRLLVIGVDPSDPGEIYLAKFFPRASITDKGDQVYMSGDTGVWWDCTFTAYEDAALGYAVRYVFAGAGWKALLTDMGFGA